MTKVIIHTNENGGVSVTYPSPEFLETNTIEDVLAKDCPENAIIVDASILPESDSDFFDAWELSGTTVSVNLTKAKALTKARLRREREPLLAAQDVLFQRAQESNADTTAIVAEKTRLRNITSLADACTTTAQLRALSC
jgi:hypothetical protein